MQRRNVVMSQMVKYDFLDEKAYDSLKQTPVEVVLNRQDQNYGLAQYFREEARKDLGNLVSSLGYDLYGDGLKIYTTIDHRMQEYAEIAVDSAMRQVQQRFDSLLSREERYLWIDGDGRAIAGFLEKTSFPEQRHTEAWWKNMGKIQILSITT